MLKERVQTIQTKIHDSVKKNFVHATLEFAFIIAYVNVFPRIFGQENNIVGIIFTIMMAASMVRDMTATPVKHLLLQAAAVLLMGLSAFLVNFLSPLAALPINLVTLFVILYAFTYEYSSHMYFPYILSYLFLIFLSPHLQPQQLPMRMAGLLAGAASIILYQIVKGRKRVVETARDVLTSMVDAARASIDCVLTGEGDVASAEEVRRKLCKLSRTVYERRKKVLCISDASFAMVDAGRGIEHLITLLRDLNGPLTPQRRKLLEITDRQIADLRAFLQSQVEFPAPLEREDFSQCAQDRSADEFYHALAYIRQHLIHMTDPGKSTHYRRTALSRKTRLKAAMGVSEVRVVYALRVSVLLAAFTLLVQVLQLPHGKWLLFTLASLSLPYADDVGLKTKKRLIATLLGGLFSVILFALVPWGPARTAIMMLSGYVSFYFSDYTGTYACSTVGALGGAVFMSSFGFGAVGQVFLIRLAYIVVGALLALLFNKVIFPYKRSAATKQLLEKYAATTELLSRVCLDSDIDPQLYYNLVVQAHLLEEQLTKNAENTGWSEDMRGILSRRREQVRRAHRSRRPKEPLPAPL